MLLNPHEYVALRGLPVLNPRSPRDGARIIALTNAICWFARCHILLTRDYPA